MDVDPMRVLETIIGIVTIAGDDRRANEDQSPS
jgi:hypothetical protein